MSKQSPSGCTTTLDGCRRLPLAGCWSFLAGCWSAAAGCWLLVSGTALLIGAWLLARGRRLVR